MDKCPRKGYVIDFCVRNDYGMRRQERRKVVKYQDLRNDTTDTYDLQPVYIKPVVIEATGLIETSLYEDLQLIHGRVTSLKLQVDVIKETVSMLIRGFGCSLTNLTETEKKNFKKCTTKRDTNPPGEGG